MIDKTFWLGHATFRIEGSKVVYFDPWKLSDKEVGVKADIILITHDHYDHLSPDDVRKIQTKDTLIVTTADGAKKLSGNVKTVAPGDTITVEGVKIEAVPAYNLKKSYHPRANGWVGFVITLDGVRIYHAGDTDFVPEMKDLKNIDIALLPVGGTYTMDAREAVEAANAINPKTAVPMHWGDIVGSRRDAEYFRDHCKVPVKIIEKR